MHSCELNVTTPSNVPSGLVFAIDNDQKTAGHGGGFLGINSNLDMFLGTGWTAAVMSNYGRGAMIPQQAMRELVSANLRAKQDPNP